MTNEDGTFDIDAYMDEQARMLRPNISWRLQESIKRGVLCWLCICCIVVAVLAPRFRFEHWPQVSLVADIIILCVAVLFIVSYFGKQAPGMWRRYSVTEFLYNYGSTYMSTLEPAILDIRKRELAAEFEVAVLVREGVDGSWGFILFQIPHTMESACRGEEYLIKVINRYGTALKLQN